MKTTDITIDKLLSAYDKKGWKPFDLGKPFNLNIFGIRNSSKRSDSFDDLIGVLYSDEAGQRIIRAWEATTDPGKYWLNHPMNTAGAAILVEGRHLGCWKLGDHHGYPALVQCKEVHVYRDKNFNDILDTDPSTIQLGNWGLNIHRANPNRISTYVDKWSAGCQVVQDPKNEDLLIMLARKSAKLYGDSFSYALFLEHEVLA